LFALFLAPETKADDTKQTIFRAQSPFEPAELIDCAAVNRKRPTAETHSEHKLNRVVFPRGPDRFLSYSFKVEFSGLAGYDFPKVRKNEDHEIKQIGEKSFKRFPPKPKN
jgi:hypothetical protein